MRGRSGRLLLVLPEEAALDDADLTVIAGTAAHSLAVDGARDAVDLLDVRVGEVVLDAWAMENHQHHKN